MTRLFAALIAALFIAPFAFAQSADDVVWIQVEAQPNLQAHSLGDTSAYACTGTILGPSCIGLEHMDTNLFKQ